MFSVQPRPSMSENPTASHSSIFPFISSAPSSSLKPKSQPPRLQLTVSPSTSSRSKHSARDYRSQTNDLSTCIPLTSLACVAHLLLSFHHVHGHALTDSAWLDPSTMTQEPQSKPPSRDSDITLPPTEEIVFATEAPNLALKRAKAKAVSSGSRRQSDPSESREVQDFKDRSIVDLKEFVNGLRTHGKEVPSRSNQVESMLTSTK